VRSDFAGGWPGDTLNKFTAAGRSDQENQAFNYVKKLANYRKNNQVLQTGKLMQFIPEDGIYVYFRYNTQQTIMIVMNSNAEEKQLATERYKERTANHKTAKNIITEEVIAIKNMKVPAKTTLVLELN
jgi:glycosidase